jgi:hypothetical protein
MGTSEERTAVLIVRAWVEPGGRGSELRARITQFLDISSGEHTVGTVASMEEVCAAVQSWLECFLTRGGPPD